jgi:hypothetical protein
MLGAGTNGATLENVPDTIALPAEASSKKSA